MNIPIGIATAVLAWRLLDREEGIGFGEGADIPGAVLITSSLLLGVYTIVKPAAELGWGSVQTLGLGAVSLVLLVAFVVREARASNPLVPLRIFRSRNVSGANVIQVLSVAGMFGMFFLGALYLERVLGYDPLQIGLAFLPVTIVMGTLSVRYAERLIMNFGARTTLIPGLVLIGAALALFAQAPADGSYVRHVLPVMILLGFGGGAAFPTLMTLAMSGATQSDAGLASGLVNTTAQVGGAWAWLSWRPFRPRAARPDRRRGGHSRRVDERVPPGVPHRGRAHRRRHRGCRDSARARAPGRRREPGRGGAHRVRGSLGSHWVCRPPACCGRDQNGAKTNHIRGANQAHDRA